MHPSRHLSTTRGVARLPLMAAVALALGAGLVVPTPAWAEGEAPSPTPVSSPGVPDPADPADDVSQPPRGDDVDLSRFPPAARAAGQAVVAAPIPPGTAVPHGVDVVVANVGDPAVSVPAVTRADIDAMLAGAARWWSGRTELAFDLTSDVAYATMATTCKTLVDDAMAAFGVAPGDAGHYTAHGRILLVLETNGDCLNVVGWAKTVSPVGDVFAGGILGVVLDPPDRAPYSDPKYAVVLAHELGHAVGLLHSNLLDCGGVPWPGDDTVGPAWSALDAAAPPCAAWEYGDTSTIMGPDLVHGLTDLSGLQRWYLGVGHDEVALVDAPADAATYALAPIGTAGPGQVGAVVLPLEDRPAAPGQTIAASVEYHTARDGVPGVYVFSAVHGDPRGPGLATDLLQPVGSAPQPHPEFQLPFVTPLGVGSAYVSADGSLRIAVLSVDGAGARIAVTRTAEPGLPGEVSLTSSRGRLSADAFSVAPTSAIAYQWFRDGRPIPGATGRTYVPPRPEVNAVFRVEATFTAPGHAATTRSSRGIVVDDARFALGPSAAGGSATARLVFLDANGRPQPCAGTRMDFAFATPSGVPVTTTRAELADGGGPGVCTASVGLPLGGTYEVTASVPSMATGQSTDPPAAGGLPLDSLRLAPFWTPHGATWSSPAAGAGASLLVGSAAPAYTTADATGFEAAIHANNGQTPARISVAVTDAAGRPAAGVLVTFHAGNGLVASPVTARTDADGLAQASLTWDPAVAPGPPGDAPVAALWGEVGASVAGFDDAAVRGSPAPVRVFRGAVGRVTGWFEGGRRTAPADGATAVTLRVRAFDAYGTPITDAPGRLRVWWVTSGHVTVTSPRFGGPTWDEAGQSYVVRLTSAVPTTGGVAVSVEGVVVRIGGYANAPSVVFTPHGDLRLALDPPGPITASAAGVCADGAATAVAVRATAFVVDPATGASLGGAGLAGGVTFAVPPGSALRLTTPATLTRANGVLAYQVAVEADRPGTYPLTVTSADGRLGATAQVVVTRGALDPAASAVSLTDGTRTADGTDAHTLTAALLTACGVPLTGLPDAGATLAVRTVAPAAAGALVEDPAHPGTYTAALTATSRGTYPVQIVYEGEGGTVALPPVPLRAAFVAPSVPPTPSATQTPVGPDSPTGGAVPPGPTPWPLGALLVVSVGVVGLARRVACHGPRSARGTTAVPCWSR